MGILNTQLTVFTPNSAFPNSGEICFFVSGPKDAIAWRARTMLLDFTTSVTSAVPPISLRISSVSHVLVPFLCASARTDLTASACLFEARRNFGDSILSNNQREIAIAKVIEPMVYKKSLRPRVASKFDPRKSHAKSEATTCPIGHHTDRSVK